MKNILLGLLIFIQPIQYGCNQSIQPPATSPVGTVVMETDSLQYIRSLAGANIGIRITNKTDSTLELPICKALEKRIDVKKANAWALGIPDWSVPCQEVIVEEGFLEKNATYGESIRIDTLGTFRVVTIYGYRRGNYTDTLFSNEFSVL